MFSLGGPSLHFSSSTFQAYPESNQRGSPTCPDTNNGFLPPFTNAGYAPYRSPEAKLPQERLPDQFPSYSTLVRWPLPRSFDPHQPQVGIHPIFRLPIIFLINGECKCLANI